MDLSFGCGNVVSIPVLVNPRHTYNRVQDYLIFSVIVRGREKKCTHCNNICPSIVHAAVIRVGPLQARVDVLL